MKSKIIVSSFVSSFVLLVSSMAAFTGSAYAGKAGDGYTECIRAIVDGHLESKKNQIKEYKFSALPKKRGFGGKVIFKSGAIIYIEEKEESSALMLFTQSIADYTSGLDWVDLRKELQSKCKHGS